MKASVFYQGWWIPAFAHSCSVKAVWIPAFAGMTNKRNCRHSRKGGNP